MLILREKYSFIDFDVKRSFFDIPILHFPRTHYSIIPLFQHSNRTTWRSFGPELKAEGLSTGWGEAPKSYPFFGAFVP